MAQFSITLHGYWTNEQYYECVVNNNNNNDNDNDNDNDDEKNDNNLFSLIDNKKNVNCLNDFVGDDSSDDQDIDLI